VNVVTKQRSLSFIISLSHLLSPKIYAVANISVAIVSKYMYERICRNLLSVFYL